MKTKFFAFAAMAVLLLNTVGFAANDSVRAPSKKRQATRLVSLLPASDGVAVFDSKRFLNEALPKILSANQPMLAQIMAQINEMETRTGIDLRKFDQVAVGVAMKTISPKNVDFEPVAIASGEINFGALIAVAKIASKGSYREEKTGERTIYIFTVKDVAQNAKVTIPNSKITQTIDQAIKGMTKEIAVAALDRNTLVLGTLGRVRETLEGTSRVSDDVSSLLSVKETAVMSFAFKPQSGFSTMIPLAEDQLGANIDSIQYLTGSLDIAATSTSVQMMARTKKAEQAVGLKDTLEGLQMIGKAVFGGSKRTDQQIYGRMIKNAKFDIRGNGVTFELVVPQADIDILVAGIK